MNHVVNSALLDLGRKSSLLILLVNQFFGFYPQRAAVFSKIFQMLRSFPNGIAQSLPFQTRLSIAKVYNLSAPNRNIFKAGISAQIREHYKCTKSIVSPMPKMPISTSFLKALFLSQPCKESLWGLKWFILEVRLSSECWTRMAELTRIIKPHL